LQVIGELTAALKEASDARDAAIERAEQAESSTAELGTALAEATAAQV
jgi:hypothetical protein